MLINFAIALNFNQIQDVSNFLRDVSRYKNLKYH